MAGAKAEFSLLAGHIRSANAGALTGLASAFRGLGAYAGTAGTTLTGSANAVGARQGEPYAAYQDRLTPTAGWLGRMPTATDPTAGAVTAAAQSVSDAQMELASAIADLKDVMIPAGADPVAAEEAAYARAVARIKPKVTAMTAAYNAIQPGETGMPPAARGASGGGTAGAGGGAATGTTRAASTGAGGASAAAGGAEAGDANGVGADGGGADTGGAGAAGVAAGAGSEAGLVGPDAGQYAGWVKDPQTGNLIDPATGREVSSQGRFIDPITGQPFGDSSQYATRLEGLAGGVGATGGLLSPPGGVAASLGMPGGAIGAGGGSGGFAGYFGGVMPPSLAGNSPISGQLERQAARNMGLRAAAATNYAAIVNGTEARPGYLPPMGGAGAGAGGAAGGARTGPRGRGLVTESGSVWGATGRGAQKEGRRRQSGSRTEVTEDADVWTGGAPTTGAGALGGH